MESDGVRVSKYLSNLGYGSRREIEKLIAQNKIYVNNKLIKTPITFVSNRDKILIDNKEVTHSKNIEIWKFYKPINFITSRAQQDERLNIYSILPNYLKKIKTVGRLDINSEGLLLLTHDGNIIRSLELPKNNFKRKYRVRVYGILNEKKLENIAKGVKIKNIQYKPFSFQILKKNKNSWIEFELFEGKKNEVRNICSILRLKVNKLIRIQFGPFKLNNLRPGQYIKADKTEYKQYENYFRKI